MIEEIANKISMYCVQLDAAKDDDREIIAFGLFHILSSLLQIILLFVFALALDMPFEITAYVVGFTSLKRYIGGAHARKHWLCLWGFTFLCFTSCFICCLLPPHLRSHVAVLAAIVMLLLVVIRAPVPHPNNPKSTERLKKLRKISITNALIQFSVIIIGCLFCESRMELYLLCVAIGGLSAATTLILPMPSQKQ